MDVGVSDCLRYTRKEKSHSSWPCQRVALLHTQHCPSVVQAAVVSAAAGTAVGAYVKHLSERLRAAQPSTSHLKDHL